MRGSSSASKWEQLLPPTPKLFTTFEQSRLWSEYTEFLKGWWCKIYLEYIVWFLGELCRRSRCPCEMLQQAAATRKMVVLKGSIFNYLFYICFYWQTDSSRTLKTQIFHESKGKKTLPKLICAEGLERTFQKYDKYGDGFIGMSVGCFT